MVALGYFFFYEANRLNDFEIEYKCYDEENRLDNEKLVTNIDGTIECEIKFTPTYSLDNPKIYYRLENFFGNHRDFVRSRDWKQLGGKSLNQENLSSKCEAVD